MLEEHIEKQNSELNKLLVEVVKNQRKSYKNLILVFIITVVSLSVILCGMMFTFIWFEKQYEVTETEEIVREVTTQEVNGEGSSINNVEGNQYNDHAIHNEDK